MIDPVTNSTSRPVPEPASPRPVAHDGRVLVVVRDPDGPPGDAGRWAGLVDALGRVFGLEAVDRRLKMDHPGWVSELLHDAAEVSGPVLVLPHPGAEHPAGHDAVGAQRHLARVVIASGDADDVVHSVRFLCRALRRAEIHTTVLVVLSNGAVPVMWEGSGHQASAWRDELRQRHGGPDQLEVLSPAWPGAPGAPGPGQSGAVIAGPGPAIREWVEESGTDLVVLVWRQVATETRAMVVRSVLAEHTGLPCLLVPLAWVTHRRNLSARAVAAAPHR